MATVMLSNIHWETRAPQGTGAPRPMSLVLVRAHSSFAPFVSDAPGTSFPRPEFVVILTPRDVCLLFFFLLCAHGLHLLHPTLPYPTLPHSILLLRSLWERRPIIMEVVGMDSELHLPECSDPRGGRTDALVFEVGVVRVLHAGGARIMDLSSFSMWPVGWVRPRYPRASGAREVTSCVSPSGLVPLVVSCVVLSAWWAV